MASLGGQGASGFAKGLGQGYGVVDKALTNKQNREIRQKEASQLAQQRQFQIDATQDIVNTVNNNSATEINTANQEAIKKQTAITQKETANKSNLGVNEIRGAISEEENVDAVNNANTIVKSNPAVANTMKSKGNIQQLDMGDPKDFNFAVTQLAEQGVTMESLYLDPNSIEDKASWRQYVEHQNQMGNNVKEDGRHVNVDKLAATTNADGSATSDQKKKIKANREAQENMTQETATANLDKKVQAVAEQATAMGYTVDTNLLKTDEQKEEFLANANKQLQAQAFQPPVKEGADESGKPKTVKSELSKIGKENPLDNDKLKHLYAIAGKPYPIKGNAKQDNYNFLVENGLDPKRAGEWIFAPAGSKSSTRMDSYTQAMTAFVRGKGGNPTEDQWREFNTNWAQKSVAGVSDVKDSKDLLELDNNYKAVQPYKEKYLNDPNAATSADIGSMASIENSNMQNNKTKAKLASEDIKQMKLRHRTINSVDSLLNDLDGKLKSSTRGPIDNMWQSFKKVVGADSVTDEMADKMKATVERDTRTGMILAEFLRMTSGLTVTEEERKFLTDIMTGGNWSDEKTLLESIKTFRNQNAEQNDVIGGTLFDFAPNSSTKYRKYDTYKKASTPQSKVDSSGNTNSEKITPKSTKKLSDLY